MLPIGSIPTTLVSFQVSFSFLLVPLMLPPVPAPATRASTLPDDGRTTEAERLCAGEKSLVLLLLLLVPLMAAATPAFFSSAWW